jgi:hypothetical protein
MLSYPIPLSIKQDSCLFEYLCVDFFFAQPFSEGRRISMNLTKNIVNTSMFNIKLIARPS